jgi:hypothetical protein
VWPFQQRLPKQGIGWVHRFELNQRAFVWIASVGGHAAQRSRFGDASVTRKKFALRLIGRLIHALQPHIAAQQRASLLRETDQKGLSE